MHAKPLQRNTAHAGLQPVLLPNLALAPDNYECDTDGCPNPVIPNEFLTGAPCHCGWGRSDIHPIENISRRYD